VYKRQAYGPAHPADYAAWAGIPLVQARQGFELVAAHLVEVDVAGRPQWMLASAYRETETRDRGRDRQPSVRLVGAFDPYLLGYASRDFALSPRFARRIQAGGGWIHPAVLVDGRILGTWRQRRTAAGLAIELDPFKPLDRSLRPLLEAEVSDLGRFVGAPAVLG